MFRGASTLSHEVGRPDNQGAFSFYCLCEKEKQRQPFSPHVPLCLSQVISLSAVQAIHCAWAPQLLANPAMSSVVKHSSGVVPDEHPLQGFRKEPPRPYFTEAGQQSISEDLNLGDQVL